MQNFYFVVFIVLLKVSFTSEKKFSILLIKAANLALHKVLICFCAKKKVIQIHNMWSVYPKNACLKICLQSLFDVGMWESRWGALKPSWRSLCILQCTHGVNSLLEILSVILPAQPAGPGLESRFPGGDIISVKLV